MFAALIAAALWVILGLVQRSGGGFDLTTGFMYLGIGLSVYLLLIVAVASGVFAVLRARGTMVPLSRRTAVLFAITSTVFVLVCARGPIMDLLRA
ncbi:hypothetical protein BWI17_00655 [Betaproteobacteria bacterium GR16-43]|nr:hypothetical protein BWI17_00655 [Betaproteobacteria bacterium GR16-43]